MPESDWLSQKNPVRLILCPLCNMGHLSTSALVALIVILWSLSPISQKYLLRTLSPIDVMVLTGIVYSMCIIGLLVHQRIQPLAMFKKLSMLEVANILFIGILGYFVSSLLYNKLMHKKESHWVVAVTYSAPILIATIIAMILLHERPTHRTFIGIILMICGILALTT